MYSHQQQRAKAKVMQEWLSYLTLEIIRGQCFWSKSCLISLLWELFHVQLGCCFGQLKPLWWGSLLLRERERVSI